MKMLKRHGSIAYINKLLSKKIHNFGPRPSITQKFLGWALKIVDE